MIDQTCGTCRHLAPALVGDPDAHWCPEARAVIYFPGDYPPCGKAKWELREMGKAEIDEIMSEVKFTDLFGVLGKEGEGNEL